MSWWSLTRDIGLVRRCWKSSLFIFDIRHEQACRLECVVSIRRTTDFEHDLAGGGLLEGESFVGFTSLREQTFSLRRNLERLVVFEFLGRRLELMVEVY